MSIFDFKSYVHGLFPSSSLSIQVLTGGVLNYTVRVSFDPPISTSLPPQAYTGGPTKSKHFQNLKTAVLKHAPPYVATIPTIPLPVSRQLVEKGALEFLHGEDVKYPSFNVNTLHSDSELSVAKVPHLLWHDPAAHVLWIEDLGELRSLSQVLLLHCPPSSESESKHQSEPEPEIDLDILAQTLADFLSSLYKSTSPSKGSFNINPLLAELKSLADYSSFRDLLADIVRDELKGYYHNLTLSRSKVDSDANFRLEENEIEVLSERVRRGFRRKGLKVEQEKEQEQKVDSEEICLAMVDFWPESILVGFDKSASHQSRQICGFIDWEYFGVSNPASELGMFVAHLHVHLLATASSTLKERIQKFIRELLRRYVTCTASAPVRRSSTSVNPANLITFEFKHLFLLAHGRELVNAVDLYRDKLEEEDEKQDDSVKARVLMAGVRSLRAAGDGLRDMHIEIVKPTIVAEGLRQCKVEQDVKVIWEAFQAIGFE